MEMLHSLRQFRLEWRLVAQLLGGYVLLTICRFSWNLYRTRSWVREMARKYDIVSLPRQQTAPGLNGIAPNASHSP
jgi:hypothetical protein